MTPRASACSLVIEDHVLETRATQIEAESEGRLPAANDYDINILLIASYQFTLVVDRSYSFIHIIYVMANMTKASARRKESADKSTAAATIGDLDAVFKGFADPTRIRILSLLAAGELCVCDIVEILDLPQPAISRHLAYLRRTGLVEVQRDAKFAHYRLALAENAVHQNLINCVRTCFRGITSLDQERRKAEKRVNARVMGPC